VAVRAVVYKEYNAAAIEALRAHGARGLDVQVKVIASRVMHEKFGVLNDDVWNGSANFSTSSITKHTEDRFLFRNMPELAARFVAEFDRLWARGS
jgi:phosphatidylserine/phosphatidylglycerophosphate/cardiolipin synthase-like enzyme